MKSRNKRVKMRMTLKKKNTGKGLTSKKQNMYTPLKNSRATLPINQLRIRVANPNVHRCKRKTQKTVGGGCDAALLTQLQKDIIASASNYKPLELNITSMNNILKNKSADKTTFIGSIYNKASNMGYRRCGDITFNNEQRTRIIESMKDSATFNAMATEYIASLIESINAKNKQHKTKVFTCIGHGCDLTTQLKLPNNWVYVTASKCGHLSFLGSTINTKFYNAFNKRNDILRDPVVNAKILQGYSLNLPSGIADKVMYVLPYSSVNNRLNPNVQSYTDSMQLPLSYHYLDNNNVLLAQRFEKEKTPRDIQLTIIMKVELYRSGWYDMDKVTEKINNDIITISRKEHTAALYISMGNIKTIYKESVYPTIQDIITNFNKTNINQLDINADDIMVDYFIFEAFIIKNYMQRISNIITQNLLKSDGGIIYNMICRSACDKQSINNVEQIQSNERLNLERILKKYKH